MTKAAVILAALLTAAACGSPGHRQLADGQRELAGLVLDQQSELKRLREDLLARLDAKDSLLVALQDSLAAVSVRLALRREAQAACAQPRKTGRR